MALQKQIVEIPIGQGLDEKTDSFLLRPGQLVRAENLRYEKNGSIKKRSAYVRDSTKNTYKVFAVDRSAVQLEASTSADYLSLNTVGTSESAIGEWTSLARAHIESPGIRGAQTWHADSEFMQGSGNTEGYVAAITLGYDGNNAPKLDVTFTDVETGLVDSSATLTVSGATSADSWHAVKCKAMRIGSTLAIAACGTIGGTTRVKLYSCDFGSTTITYQGEILTQLYTGVFPVFDLDTISSQAMFGAISSSSVTTINVKIWASSGGVGSAGSITCASQPYSMCLYSEYLDGQPTTGIPVDGHVFFIDNGAIKKSICRFDGSTTVNTFTAVGASTTVSNSVTTGNLSTLQSNNMVGFGYAGNNSTDWQSQLLLVNKASDSTIRAFSATTLVATIYGHSVVAKPYVHTESVTAKRATAHVLTQPVWEIGSSPRHYSVFNVNASYTATWRVSETARLAYASARALIGANSNGLPVSKLHRYGSSAEKFAGVVYVTSDAPSNATLNATHTPPVSSARMAIFDKSRSGSIGAVSSAGSTLFTGANSLSFDGVSVRPNGLLYPPEIVSASSTTGSGSLESGKSYGFAAVLEYTDANGIFHQSAASSATTLAASTTKCELALRMVPQSLPADANIAIYRTAGNGTTYYRAAYQRVIDNTVTYTFNDASLNSLDSSIAGNNVLYTQTGEAENIQLGSTIAIAGDSLRVYAVSGDDPYALRISKPLEQWRGVAFFDGVDRRVPSAYGPITGLARIDGRIYVATEKAVFVAQGDGPDINGANDTLSELSLVSGSFGANDQSSIYACDVGVFVFGRKGFWLIGRDGAANYIGAAVEDSVTATSRCYGMAYVPDLDELHMAMGTLGVYVYSAQGGQWSKNPNMQAFSIAAPMRAINSTRGAVFVATDPSDSNFNPGVYRSGTSSTGTTSYTDEQDITAADNRYTMAVGMGWIHLAGIQGLQRVYEGLILGRLRDTCSIKVSLSYDYVDTVVDTFTITSANATADSSNLQFRFMPSRQRCEAIKILIEDVVSSGSQAFELVGLSLVVGVIPGVFKLSTTKAAT